MSKKALSLSTSAVEFLFSIVNSQKAASKAEINKLRALFNAIVPVRKAYQDEGEALRKEYRTERTMKDANGNETVGYVIPADKSETYQKEVDALKEKKVEVEFDVESLSFLKTIVDGIFARPELKDGIADEIQITMYAEVSDAIDAAVAGK